MNKRARLSAFVTTLNNEATLARCLASIAWADEIVVLDSGSTDRTRDIALDYRARWFVEPFKGYGAQKKSAMEKTTHRWTLMLDADEWLAPGAREAIELALVEPRAAGFELPRRERVFWRWQHRLARHNAYLRVFDKTQARFSEDPIHAAPQTDGTVAKLPAFFFHYGEPDIQTKVRKINDYSTGMVGSKLTKNQRAARLRMVLYPPWHFFRNYVLKRRFLSGWAGFIACVVEAFYAFLKYAKLYEARQNPKN